MAFNSLQKLRDNIAAIRIAPEKELISMKSELHVLEKEIARKIREKQEAQQQAEKKLCRKRRSFRCPLTLPLCNSGPTARRK